MVSLHRVVNFQDTFSNKDCFSDGNIFIIDVAGATEQMEYSSWISLLKIALSTTDTAPQQKGLVCSSKLFAVGVLLNPPADHIVPKNNSKWSWLSL